MRRRRLSPDEKTLWTDVIRSIAPLRKRHAAKPEDGEAAAPPSPASPSPKHKARPRAPVAPAAPSPPAVSRPQPLGRKARRRLARGADAIDGRLDLHGMTQAQAHDALLRFLRRSSGHDAKVVLVITGKGGAGGEGVLKRQVPMWLHLPEFREFVVGFEAAAVGHGGAGALYIRLRRLRRE